MTDGAPHTGYAKIEEELAARGVYYATTVGDSMSPLLRTRRNTVVLRRPAGRAAVGDVILFRRPDGRYVLHRVLRVTPEGYITRGDNRRRDDPPVPEDAYLAVMDGYYKKKRLIPVSCRRYRTYVALWGMPNPVRALWLYVCDALRRLLGKTPRG